MCLWALLCTGTCNLVTASGSSLSMGADLIVNDGITNFMAVSALSSGSSAVVCYKDLSNSWKGMYATLCQCVVERLLPTPVV